MKINQALSSLIILLCTACAFKDQTPLQGSGIINPLASETTLGIAKATIEFPSSDPSKSKVSREITGSIANFKSTQPITLPESVPYETKILLEFDSGALSGAKKIFPKITDQDRDFSLSGEILSIAKIDQKEVVTLLVQGFNLAVKNGFTPQGDLEIDFFSETQKISEAHFEIRVTPTQFKTSLIAKGDALARMRSASIAEIATSKNKSILLTTFNLKNDEKYPIEVTLPKKLDGWVGHQAQFLSYFDHSCKDGGVQSNIFSEVLYVSKELFLLPLNENLLIELKKYESDPSKESALTVMVLPSQELAIGVYGAGPIGGPFKTEISTRDVPGPCHFVPPSRPVRGEPTEGYWTPQETKKMDIGQIVYNLEIHLKAPLSAKARFGDLDATRDFSERTIRVLEKQTEINN